MVTMAIRAGSHSLFNAHTPSGCPQHLHTLFKAFQGRGCLPQLHPLMPQGPDLPACTGVPPLCPPRVLANQPPGTCAPSHRGMLASRKAGTEKAGCYTAPRWLLRVTGHWFSPHTSMLSTQGPFSQVQQVTLTSETGDTRLGHVRNRRTKGFR